jgi:hypothetical protein
MLAHQRQEYQAVKDSIIRYEREMLRVFGFIVHCDHPHKLLISFVKVLDGGQDLIQEAWNIVNDRCVCVCVLWVGVGVCVLCACVCVCVCACACACSCVCVCVRLEHRQ